MEFEGGWAHLTEDEQTVTGYETPIPVKYISIPAHREATLDLYEEISALEAKLAQNTGLFSAQELQELAEKKALLEAAPAVIDGMEFDLRRQYETSDPELLVEVASI